MCWSRAQVEEQEVMFRFLQDTSYCQTVINQWHGKKDEQVGIVHFKLLLVYLTTPCVKIEFIAEILHVQMIGISHSDKNLWMPFLSLSFQLAISVSVSGL